MSSRRINIAETQPVTDNLGVGKRFAIWVQGCPFNCKNCISPYWIPFELNKPIRVDRLAEKILDRKEIEGITISGGEPFMQAESLGELLEVVKGANPLLNVIVFTGFKYERLEWDSAKKFLKNIDVLIDGLYVESLNNDKGLRGSTNQRVHFLTDVLLKHKDYFLNRERSLEYHRKRDGHLIVGIPLKN